MRVLLAEDEETIAVTLRHALEDAGHQVTLAADTQRALQHLASDNPDVVLTDIRMPGGGGMELLRRSVELDAHRPVVLMTGHLGGINAPRARSAAIAAILKKPLRSRTLAECLARHLPAGGPPPAGASQPRAAKPRRGILEPSGREGA